ncbi:DNA polymerase III subunit gamma/tau [Marinivivus vitaminiproducens]|uniref:DNA polymerase III subunit gamma/tau n=1 Tax=Marinivivus vitaminiproducens TaxID=3035935 RepID=UPI0027A141A1|nr:DNA polymerase III subunit gamma/tau [Geminicoccaceae bacterium SCSIO 64248]
MPETEPNGPYRVLARTYRPERLSELIGQDALVRTLTNAFASGRVAHAFMLTGIRGVGKTTTARIIARALNCIGPDGEGPPTPEPCGVCANCIAIAEGRHIDVLEMDAASHTGINDIREIIDGIRYGPTSGRYKVYIIDEVHMLSQQAFNGLLKTLEEPPPHAKFLFATTEIRKVPVTVLSRCQRFDLRRVEPAVLRAHLERIAAKEGFALEPAALDLIVRSAEGSVRDSLSLLDQAIALSDGAVRAADVKDMLGLSDRVRVLDLFELLLRGDSRAALDLLTELDDLGADPVTLVQDLLDLCHGLTRAKLSPEAADGLGLGPDEAVRARTMAGELSMAVLARCWQMLLRGLEDLRLAPSPMAAAEMLLIRMAFAADLPTPDLLQTGPGPAARQGEAPRPSPVAGPPTSRPETVAVAEPATTRPTPGGGFGPTMALAQPAARPEAAAVPAEPALAPQPGDLAEVVALVRSAGEPIVASWMHQAVHLVRFEPGRIEIRQEPHAPADLAARAGAALTRATDRRWIVTLVNEQGAPTLAEQAEQARAAALVRAAEDPNVRRVLDRFPGARLEDVRPAD